MRKKKKDLISLLLNILYLHNTGNELGDRDKCSLLFLFNMKQAYLKV